MNAEPIFEVRNVTMSYGKRCVLAIDEFDILKGEILALVGPSGVGKSTLLRILNFLEPPTTGLIRFQGRTFQSGQDVPLSVRRRVTTVFQKPVLLRRSVEANVAYGLQLRGERVNGQVHAALEAVGLADLVKQPARTLSSGEAQRLALARAMILRPDVLLLDEPTANLDPYNVGLIEKMVRQINTEHGTTIVLVTHNVFQAKRLAGRAALMLDGRIVEAADVHRFFESPRDERTSAFVRGEMVY
ncbi:MAG: phosphate ABC transporter ATP-binding protein [Caldilineaceae bacterium]|nr:phosphate ABC transporter ATP-binding protein [Caldilineaceae bacterium]